MDLQLLFIEIDHGGVNMENIWRIYGERCEKSVRILLTLRILLSEKITGFIHFKPKHHWNLMLKMGFRHNLLYFALLILFMYGLYLNNDFWILFLRFYCFYCCWYCFVVVIIFSLYLFLLFVVLLGIIFLGYSAFLLFMFVAYGDYFMLF